MKNRHLLTIVVFMMALASCTAKQGYYIKISSNDLKGDTVTLAHYKMGALINNDSIIVDQNGNGVFKGSEPLKEGNYVLYLKDGNYVDVLMGKDQRFSVTLDTLNMPANVKFRGAKETEDFFEYTLLFFKNKKEIEKIVSDAQANPNADIEAVRKEIEAKQNIVVSKKEELVKKYEGEMLSVFLNGYDIPQPDEMTVPDGCSNPDSVRASMYYAFFRDNYLANIDFADERSYYTPYVRQRIDTYLNKVLVQQYDSIIPQAIKLVERSTPNDSAFKIMASYMLKYATNYDLPGFLDMRHIMGIDNLIVELADRYYLNGKAFWADSTQLASLKKKADKIRYCQIGKPAVNIPIANITGEYDSLYNKCGTVFTVLVFYEPDCGHCQKRLPVIADFYKQYENDERVNVIAFCMKDTKNEWIDFIKTYNTGNLINVWDPERKSNYWTNFDTSETPMIYILDSEKRIEAKNLEPEQLYGVASYKKVKSE
ncbi:MAG: redoxin domain-containing protein [Paludibacteraceae bacterium]|nr:redoxin domain-containing protein [Paludibacteraceae bacterium]